MLILKWMGVGLSHYQPVQRMKSSSLRRIRCRAELAMEAKPEEASNPSPCCCSDRTDWLRWAVRVKTAPATVGISSPAASSDNT